MNDLRFPVGPFARKQNTTPEERSTLISQIAEAPIRLRAAVGGMSDEQLDTPYRPEGWTVRQVVHHLPDSHLNAYVRFKLAMTEERPTIKPYKQELWAELADSKTAPIDPSLTLLESLHLRWVAFLRSLSHADFARELNHPENGLMTLDAVLQLYAWHGRHHIAQITSLKERKGWGDSALESGFTV
jgi:uncharacterized damage-inducible protein DinB